MSAELLSETSRDDSLLDIPEPKEIPGLAEVRDEQELCRHAIEYCKGVLRGEEAMKPELEKFFAKFDGPTIFSHDAEPPGLPDWVKQGCIITHETNLSNSGNMPPPGSHVYYSMYETMARLCQGGYADEVFGKLVMDTVENRKTLVEAVCEYVPNDSAENARLLALCGVTMAELAWHARTDNHMLPAG